VSWYAVEAVGDALGATRRFLLPFEHSRWLRLALLVLFVGGGGTGTGGANLTTGVPDAGTVEPGDPPALPDPGVDPAVVAAVAAVLVAGALAVGLFASVLRFVYYDALRTDEVRLIGPFRRRFTQGVRLFAFRVGLAVAAFGPLVAVGYLLFVRPGNPPVGVAGLSAFALVALAVALPYWLVDRFTLEFVVPVMTLSGSGVLPAWRSFLPTLRAEWKQFLLYLAVHFLVALVAGVLEGIVATVVGLGVVFVAVVVAVVGVIAAGGIGTAVGSLVGVTVLALLFVVGTAVVVAALLPVRIVTVTYLATYELTVLASANPEFALLSEGLTPSGTAGDGPA